MIQNRWQLGNSKLCKTWQTSMAGTNSLACRIFTISYTEKKVSYQLLHFGLLIFTMNIEADIPRFRARDDPILP